MVMGSRERRGREGGREGESIISARGAKGIRHQWQMILGQEEGTW